uniref:Putative tick transposon n=1 Tax=Rhipicephalus microplus TaxID=6941 RepID=A0A6G5AB10_RHIMP
MVGRIAGKQVHTLPLVNTQGDTLEDQANFLGAHFERVSSSSHYTDTFQKYRTRIEKQKLEHKSTRYEAYNQAFSLAELRTSLNSCSTSAPGSDRVVYEMLKNLPAETRKTLLCLYNAIWFSGTIPTSWKEAIIIPILKEGKDPSLASGYRAIALTSCLCKAFEKVINCRLVDFLETNNLLDPFQCGFRESRSTTDHLVRIEAQIRDAFVHEQYCLSVFLDIEKAYDTT